MSIYLTFAFIGFAFSTEDNNVCHNNETGEICEDSCSGTKICTLYHGYTALCCDWTTSPCTETGMHNFFDIQGQYASSRWIDADKKLNYKKNFEVANKVYKLACPVPTPFIFGSDVEKTVAVGFSGEGSKPKRCTSHGQCGVGEFCALAYNPSYCNTEKADKRFHNNCMDKSNNGLAFAFCFPDPKFPANFFVAMKDDIDLAVCNTHQDCHQASRFCDRRKKVNKIENGKLVIYDGICYKAHVCDVFEDISNEGTLGRNNQLCTLGDDNSCPIPNSRCIESPIQLGNEILSFCCTSKFDQNQMGNHKKADNDFDINNGTKYKHLKRLQDAESCLICNWPNTIIMIGAVTIIISCHLLLFYFCCRRYCKKTKPAKKHYKKLKGSHGIKK